MPVFTLFCIKKSVKLISHIDDVLADLKVFSANPDQATLNSWMLLDTYLVPTAENILDQTCI